MENNKVSNTNKVEVKETKVKTNTNNNMTNKVITTDLLGKEEVFKMLALAEALGLAILLIGVPGTGKTKCVTDYGKSGYDLSTEEGQLAFMNEVFILETDEGTKSSEVKGTVNMKKLIKEQEYTLNSPITTSKYVVINEVDKASAALRNSLLGIMNEKVLFNGQSKVPCEWNLFVATCNEIPKEEMGNPFWDRFPLKMEVSRMSAGDMVKYFKAGDKKYSTNLTINMPTKELIDSINIPLQKLEKFIQLAHKKLSDRTISFVPIIAKNVSVIYNCSIDKALIKTAEILCDKGVGQSLQKELISEDMRKILDKAELLTGMSNEKQIEQTINEIEKLVNDGAAKGKFSEQDTDDITKFIEDIMENHPHYSISIEK